MRKLSLLATTLLCSSLALAQEDDYSDYGSEASAVEAPAEESVSEESSQRKCFRRIFLRCILF